MFTKEKIRKKTAELGLYTIVSRILGITREVLMVRYLGPTALSDAFLTAFKLPNSLRKFFAEGALSAVLVPSLVQKMKASDKKGIDGIMSVSFFFFEGLVLLICILVMTFPEPVFYFMAPGFSASSIIMGTPLLRVLMPFIFFLSSSAVMGGALHATGHFFAPAFGPIVLNIAFIGGILACLFFNLPVIYLCWFILLGGVAQFLMHLYVYLKSGFGFGAISKENIRQFWDIGLKFLLCLPTVSVMELNLFIDMAFASYLPAGDISLLYYANRFANIPIGVFAVALSTILLPHLSHVVAKQPRRLSFYVLESTKLVAWVIIPTTFLTIFFSRTIFYTLFLSKKFTVAHVDQAATILIMFAIGLISFSLNKILVNIYYAKRITWVPSAVAAGTTGVNFVLNWFFLQLFQVKGLALATSISALVQTALLFLILRYRYGVALPIRRCAIFLTRYLAQLSVILPIFYAFYEFCVWGISTYFFEYGAHLLLETAYFWFWVGPLAALLFGVLWLTRSFFGVTVYFIT